MLSIHRYNKTFQNDIDLMMDAIATEFESPISSSKNSKSQNLDACWVAFYKTDLIGTIGILKIDSAFSVIKNMFVKKDFRGSVYGVAQQLLNTAYDWCLTQDISHMYLGTMNQFKAAQKFYEKNRFVKIELTELPSGFIRNPIDTVFYVKVLNYSEV
ncbi:GNAT family N-acetyltransferase [Winogradskyella forsetii]|uniref:GNAT family N-acetyltransferase n=1 Tax=Winogradskyella forsetii TaxID=2686077 RepID=UPI0015BB8FFA|nr:GNAT family N-acetyltransferase [Winogradskyella forsetii]